MPRPPRDLAGGAIARASSQEPFDVDGKLYGKQIKVGLLVDGYTAPITAGNFVDLVNKGFYNGMHVQVAPPI